MLPDIIEILLPIVLILTTMAILIMLPMYFIRKKRNPDNPKNTIKRFLDARRTESAKRHLIARKA